MAARKKSEAFRWAVRGGGRWWIRWPIRLLILAGIVLLGFIPYDHEVGGPCHVTAATQQGVRAVIAAEIAEIHVVMGDQVEAGALIATLAARDERADVKKTTAELARAQADLDLLEAGTRAEDLLEAEQTVELRRVELEFAEAELKRQTELIESGDAGVEDVQTAQRNRDAAVQRQKLAQTSLDRARNGPRAEEIRAAAAEVARLQAELALQQELLALAEIRTPIAGRVVTSGVGLRRGQWVEEGDLIAVIRDASTLQVEVWAEEPAAALIEEDMAVKVRFEAYYGEAMAGRVRAVFEGAEEKLDLELDLERFRSDRETLVRRAGQRGDERLVRVIVDLEEAPPGLSSGMTGYARVVIDDERVLWEAVWRSLLRFFRVEVWSWLP